MWDNRGNDRLNGGIGAGEYRGLKSFLCSEYDDGANMEANENDSWDRGHRCNIEKKTANGKS